MLLEVLKPSSAPSSCSSSESGPPSAVINAQTFSNKHVFGSVFLMYLHTTANSLYNGWSCGGRLRRVILLNGWQGKPEAKISARQYPTSSRALQCSNMSAVSV